MTPSLWYAKPQDTYTWKIPTFSEQILWFEFTLQQGCSFPVKTYRSTGFQLYMHVLHRINVWYIHLWKTDKNQVNVGKYT